MGKTEGKTLAAVFSEEERRKRHALMLPAEIAETLRVSPRTLRRWRRTGKGPPCLTVGRIILYPEQDLEEWIRRKKGEGRCDL